MDYNLPPTILPLCRTNSPFRSHPCTGCQHVAPVLHLGFCTRELTFRETLERATYSQGKDYEIVPVFLGVFTPGHCRRF